MAKSFGAVPGVGQIAGIASELQQLTGAIKGFVAALAPSIVLEFNQAMLSLQATIGAAFTGAMNVISSFTREIAGVLLPVMQKLEPVMRTFANIFGNTLLGSVKLLASALETLTPLLQMVADLYNEYTKFMLDLVSIVVAFSRVLRETLSGIFGGNLKDTFKGFFDQIRNVVKALVTFAATLAVFAGFGAEVRAFGAAIAKEARDRETRPAGLQGAATGGQITSIEEWLRQQQISAVSANAGGGAREKSEVEWLKEIATALNATSTKQSFREALDEWWATSVKGTWLGQLVVKIDQAWAEIKAFFSRPWGR